MPKILLISSSSLHTFLECRKAYDLTWFRGLEPLHENKAIERGTSFHSHAATFVDAFQANVPMVWKKYVADNESDEMLTVFRMYRKLRWDLKPEQIVMASAADTRWEHPLYLPLVKTGGYDVWIRFTLDFVYRDENGWICINDWKTFSQMPSTANSDLDFQGRGSIALAQRYYEEDRVQFGWRYVRSVPPGSPRGTGPWTWDGERNEWFKIKDTAKGPKREVADVWTEEECYPPIEWLACSKSESDEMWIEMQNAARDLVRCMREGRWYRSPRRGTMPYTCHTCLAKLMCKSEIATGVLDEDTIAQLAVPRAPIEIPENEWNRWRTPRRKKREKKVKEPEPQVAA